MGEPICPFSATLDDIPCAEFCGDITSYKLVRRRQRE
jgi:predicted nucleic acid-binding Zn ribbon protein